MKVAILCGGQASRLGLMTTKTPKSLIPVGGKPFIFHQLDMLAKSEHIEEIVLCTGFLGNQIYQAVGTEHRGLPIRYSRDGAFPLGTSGALRNALHWLGEEPFSVLYGDMYLKDVDYLKVIQAFGAGMKRMPIMMTIIANDNPRHRNNVALRPDGRILYDKVEPPPDAGYIDYGLSVMTPEALRSNEYMDLASVFHEWSLRKRLNHMVMTEPFYSIGSPTGLQELRDLMEVKS